jgi:hypothetical protein
MGERLKGKGERIKQFPFPFPPSPSTLKILTSNLRYYRRFDSQNLELADRWRSMEIDNNKPDAKLRKLGIDRENL